MTAKNLEKKLKVRRLELVQMVDCPRYEKLVSRGGKCSGCKYFHYLTLDLKSIGCSYKGK